MAGISGWLIPSLVTMGVGALSYIVRQLWKRWRERFVEHLDRALRRKASLFERRYRELMLSSLRFIDVKGLATVGFYTPELDEVFVDVSLAYRAPHQIGESLLAQPPAEVTERRSIGEFLDRPNPVVLAMVGVPGSGKTTLLRHTARAVCQRRRKGRRRVPILLYLRDHVAKIVADPGVGLPALVLDTLRRGMDEPPDWFEQRLKNGDCVVLLDGLDEVAKQDDRTKVATWVSQLTRHYPRNDFVITSRPQGYLTAGVDGATVVQVRNFTDEQVTRFVRGWCVAIEKHSTGESGQAVQLRADEAADDLLKRLATNPGLYDLTVNPLLLTMIANVHRFRGALPGSRTDLYGEICQVMLGRRQEAKNLPIELSRESKEAILRKLAFTMMRLRVRDLPREDVYEELTPALRRLSTKLTQRSLLADLGSNGLLIEREVDLFTFAHLTFQEYLASTYIRDNGLVATLTAAVDDVWWRETTLLYTARWDADPIVTACLNSGSVSALSLAFDIVDQGSGIAPELRTRLNELLAIESDDPDRQRLRVAVLVARHLRDQIRTGTGGRVCAQPVTTELYKLFLAANRDIPLPDGLFDAESTGPVTGVHRRDAVAFTHWINSVTGSEPGYRLPTAADISDPAVQRVLRRTPTLSVWLAPDGEADQPKLWAPAYLVHPNRIHAIMLGDHIYADIERSTPTLTHLLLFRSLTTVRALQVSFTYGFGGRADSLARALGLYRIRPLARALGFYRSRSLSLALAHDLARTLDLARDLERRLDDRVAIDLDLASDRARTLDRTLDLGRDRVHDEELAHDLELAVSQAVDRARVRVLDHTLALDFAVDRYLERIRDPGNSLDLMSDGDRTTSMFITGASLMGNLLAMTLGRVLSVDIPPEHWLKSFARFLADETDVTTGSWVVSVDVLDKEHEGWSQLRNLDGPTWSHSVVVRLEVAAASLAASEDPVTADTATAIRLAALCLAAEADRIGLVREGNRCREIAAAITLLERRTAGLSTATETIMLARSDN